MASMPPIGDPRRMACLVSQGWWVGKEAKIEDTVSLFVQITFDLACQNQAKERGLDLDKG